MNPYEDDDNLSNLRLNFAQQGEDDGGPSLTCQNNQNEGPKRGLWASYGETGPPVARFSLC